MVVGCDTPRASEVMREVYRPLFLNETQILFTSRETSELIKYAANAFLDGGAGNTMASGQVAYQTLQTAFDLAAYNLSFGQSSAGDYTKTAGCPADPTNGTFPGCPFPASGGTGASLKAEAWKQAGSDGCARPEHHQHEQKPDPA